MDYSKPIRSIQSLTRGVRGKKGLVGIQEVSANLNRALSQIKDKSMLGLVEASIIIRRDMEDTPPLIPVDLGNLRASWFTTANKGEGTRISFQGKQASKLAAEKSELVSEMRAVVNANKKNPSLIMGFSANYAAPVHEMVGVNFKRPNSGAKFFQAALSRNTKLILRVIKDTVVIPP